MHIHKMPDKEFKITVSKKFCEPQDNRDTLLYGIVKEHTNKSKQRQKNIRGRIKQKS